MRQTLSSKLYQSIQRDGWIGTAIKVLSFPVSIFRRRRFHDKILPLSSAQDKFTWIYENNFWQDDESASGSGSTMGYTKNLRAELPKIFEAFEVKSVFDAPCGDFNWMSQLFPRSGIAYVGGDIVLPLIDKLNRLYKAEGVTFIHFDLTKSVPPKADLMIVRDCLFHFSYLDAKSFLDNFLLSETPYLLTTTHANPQNTASPFANNDISTGDFRLIDLFSPPFNFPRSPLYVVEDWVPGHPQRKMCLWDRSQIMKAVEQMSF